jgi:hypothetical protein
MTKFKVGDPVRCLPGFKNGRDDDLVCGGGSGYREGLIFVIENITTPSHGLEEKGSIYWGGLDGNGVYEIALELAGERYYEIY